MRPKVLIAMACYNAAEHLHRSIGSILAQDMPDWQLQVVDDGSSDDSWSRLQAFAAMDSRIRVSRQANAGSFSARNRALAEGEGAFIAFLDADDTWEPTFLSLMCAALEADAAAGLAYCGWQNIGLGGGSDKPYVPPDHEAGNKLESFLKGCPWPIHGALVRAELVREAGCFDTSLSSCLDYDLWLRLGIPNRLVLVPHVLAYYYHHGGEQITKDKARIGLNNLRVQLRFLERNPGVVRTLGRRRVRECTFGGLMHRGYVAYWKRDLRSARILFRQVMKHGYGGTRDWLYMLPAWLPESWHSRLLDRRDGGRAA